MIYRSIFYVIMSTFTSEQLSMSSQDLDYFESPSKLFKCIEDHAWDVAIRRLERMPQEARLWIVRRAFDGSTVWRRLPIHEALIQSAPIAVIEGLLNAYPDSAKEVGDSSKRLAIHYACEHNASTDVIKLLLITHPSCLNESDNGGNTPGKYLENVQYRNVCRSFSTRRDSGSVSSNPPQRSQGSMQKSESTNELTHLRNEQNGDYQNVNIALQVLQEELINVQRQNEELKQQVLRDNKKYEKHVQDNAETMSHLKQTLDSSNAEIFSLKEKLSIKENDLIHLKKVLSNTHRSAQVLDEDKKRMETNFKQIKEELENKNKQISLLEEKLKEMKADYQEKVERSDKRIKTLDEELFAERKINAELNRCAIDLENKLQEAVETIKDAEERFFDERQNNDVDYINLEEELDCTIEKMNSLQSIVKDLETELRQKKEDIKSLQESVQSADKDATIEELSDQLDQLKGDYARLQSYNVSLRKYEYDNMELVKANDSLMMENKVLVRENFDLKVQNHITKEDNTTLESTIKSFHQLMNTPDTNVKSKKTNDLSIHNNSISVNLRQENEQMDLKQRLENIKHVIDTNFSSHNDDLATSKIDDINRVIRDDRAHLKTNVERRGSIIGRGYVGFEDSLQRPKTFTETRHDQESDRVPQTFIKISSRDPSRSRNNTSTHFFHEDISHRNSNDTFKLHSTAENPYVRSEKNIRSSSSHRSRSSSRRRENLPCCSDDSYKSFGASTITSTKSRQSWGSCSVERR